MNKISCSVEILTRNSENTLEQCLESVKDFAEILVLDGNSTDRTLEIAGRYGARILKQYETNEPLVSISDFSEVRNKGLRLAKYDWFMFIDSDEYLSPEAVEEIRSIAENPHSTADAFWQPRKYVLNGKIIDCATTYPNRQIRLFKKSKTGGFKKPVHERIKLKEGARVGTLRHFEYLPVEGIEELRARWKRYMIQELDAVKGVRRTRLLRYAFGHGALFLFCAYRYFRGLFFCRGNRMPLSYEWARHSYSLRTIGHLVLKMFS